MCNQLNANQLLSKWIEFIPNTHWFHTNQTQATKFDIPLNGFRSIYTITIQTFMDQVHKIQFNYFTPSNSSLFNGQFNNSYSKWYVNKRRHSFFPHSIDVWSPLPKKKINMKLFLPLGGTTESLQLFDMTIAWHTANNKHCAVHSFLTLRWRLIVF